MSVINEKTVVHKTMFSYVGFQNALLVFNGERLAGSFILTAESAIRTVIKFLFVLSVDFSFLISFPIEASLCQTKSAEGKPIRSFMNCQSACRLKQKSIRLFLISADIQNLFLHISAFDIQLGALVTDIITLENIAVFCCAEQSCRAGHHMCGLLPNCLRRCCTTTTAMRYSSARLFNKPISI